MKDYKKIIFLTILFSLIIGGCASNNIEIIEQKKQYKIKSKIHISQNIGYKAYIDRDNNLKFICMNSRNFCNYYSPKKHSYNNGTPEEEYFLINEDGYYPPLSPNAKHVQCGTGSLWGYVAILGKPFSIQDYSKKHPIVCNSRFTSIDRTQLTERFIFGLITFMTPFVTGGTLHTNRFDKQKFIDIVYESNIESFRKKLLESAHKFNIDKGIDFIYLDENDVKDSLEEKYNSLLTDKSLKSGVIFMQEDNHKFLAMDIFNKYKSNNILKSISLQVEDILNQIAKNNQNILTYKDIISYIPPKIPLPKIPPAKKLFKSEFETKAEFQKRVIQAVKERENKIRRLQRQYSLAVAERNKYIENLQKTYQKYLEKKVEERNKLLKELKENIPLLSKVLFLENTSGYSADNFRYDAETQKLYFTIYSKNELFKYNVVSIIPAEDAKSIKLYKAFKIIPKMAVNKNSLILKGFKILATESNNLYDVKYTNINYKPEVVSLRITRMKENIKQALSKSFKKFKQKDISIVDTSKKEIWYIDVVKSINAKIPKWFSNPVKNKVIAYGEGKTLKEAQANARAELAFIKKTKIKSKFNSIKEINNFKHFSKIKNDIQEKTDVELKSDEYRLYKQEKMDGIWYVGYEYLKNE